MATAAPPRPAPPPPPKTSAPAKTFNVTRGVTKTAHRVGIYGTGGIGKTSLAALAPDPLIIDLEGGSEAIDVARVADLTRFEDVRDLLHSDIVNDFQTITIDSGTVLQDWALDWALRNVKHEKGHTVSSIEGYGFGKGFTHVYETFVQIIADLDALVRKEKNVVLICHARTELAPNPEGEDYLRYEPDLQQPPKNGRLRDRVKNWVDHLLFLNYDVAVNKEGKAQGSGSRTIYPQEMPTFWAKSRTLRDPIPFTEGDRSLWDMLATNTTK